MSFLADNCTFTVLTKEVIDASHDFDCGHNDLNEFFRIDCINYSEQLLGKTYCFLFDADPQQIVCAFTVSNDSIKTRHWQNNPKRRLVKNIPHQKQFNSYPAVLIGRLGVNVKFKGKGIGRELMDFVKSWFIDANNKTGCRFIVVDSYNEPGPLKYYERNGFNYIFLIEDQEKESIQIPLTENLRTRLMYFDLIILSTKSEL